MVRVVPLKVFAVLKLEELYSPAVVAFVAMVCLLKLTTLLFVIFFLFLILSGSVYSGYVKEIEDKPTPTTWGKKMPFGNLMAEFSNGRGTN